jgi:hypothetical protein
MERIRAPPTVATAGHGDVLLRCFPEFPLLLPRLRCLLLFLFLLNPSFCVPLNGMNCWRWRCKSRPPPMVGVSMPLPHCFDVIRSRFAHLILLPYHRILTLSLCLLGLVQGEAPPAVDSSERKFLPLQSWL